MIVFIGIGQINITILHRFNSYLLISVFRYLVILGILLFYFIKIVFIFYMNSV